MKRIVCIALLFLLLAGTGLSQPEDRADRSAQQEEMETEKGSEEKTGKPDDAEWPPPFKPSEAVGADAMISFPTDI